MITLHVVGLPWTETTSEFLTCAYTQKIVKFGEMMASSPYRVVIYSGVENEATCDEHVPLLQPGEREKWFQAHDQNSVWSHITWDPKSDAWTAMNARAAKEILARAAPEDIVLLVAGHAQTPLVSALGGMLSCEPFVGYYGIASEFCAFESHAWRNHVYGNKNIQQGRWYDTVIPNYFVGDDFHLAEKEDYLLFMGRVTVLKGPKVAAEVAAAAGRRLLVAGGGVNEYRHLPGGGVNIYADGGALVFGGKHVEYVGPVGVEERAELMAKATALLAPTLYIGPFEGVTIEAMLSGTPAVTTDWGVFPETVVAGKTGYRFTTLAEGVEAVDSAAALESVEIYNYARALYTLEAVQPRFNAWFERLDDLRGDGWYSQKREEVAA